METTHWVALGLSFGHEVGTVGTAKDLPALGPAFVVQDQKKGWASKWWRTERGTAGGAKRALKEPLGKACQHFPISERRIVHGEEGEH